MRFQCPLCNGIVAIDNSSLGIKVQCGHCSGVIDVPDSRVAPGAIIADFIIQRELGRGGMGVVYLAHQISLDRPSALKILSENYANDAQFVGNFIKEARAAAKLNHPHIVQAYAVGEDEGIFYFAMEDIDGKTMKEVLKEQQQIPSDQALLIVQQIAEALDYAWREQKLIHRDIKPDNIMLTNSGRAKLSDLGLASIAGELDESNSDEIMGTPQYISPEHLTGSPMDVRSDIYSLGATFYHFVTGTFPYQGKTAIEIAQQHLTGTLIPPNEVNPEVPADVSAIIMKMMARVPTERYQNTEQLIDDIRTARHAVDGVTATIQLPAPGSSGKAKKTGGLRLSTNHTSGKQLTLKRSGSSTATNLQISGNPSLRLKSKKKSLNKKLLIGIGAGAAVLLIAGAVIGCLLFLDDSSEPGQEEAVKNTPPPPPEPSQLEKDFTAFHTKAVTNNNKQELLLECEDFILNKPETMTAKEAELYAKILDFYRDTEEFLLKAARMNAVGEHKSKLQSARKREEERAKREKERRAAEEAEKAAKIAAEKAAAKAAAEKAAFQKKAKEDLAALKKDTAAKIFTVCKEGSAEENAEEVEKILTEAIENEYKNTEDEVIKPLVAELTEWIEGLRKSFRNAARIAELLKGKDKLLDDLVVVDSKGKKYKLQYNQKRKEIFMGYGPLKQVLEPKNKKKNRSVIPGLISAVAEKIEASDDLWAYKLITNEKYMPEDFDTTKLDELKSTAGIEEESGDDGEE